MADSKRSRRRPAGASSSRPYAPQPTTINGWISDKEKHAEYVHLLQERRIMAVKFIQLDFYKFCGFRFPDLFGTHGLTHLVEQKGCIYPDLIRVFYFNLCYRDGIFTTKVKGVPIILDDDIWTTVAYLTIWDDVVKVHLRDPDFNRLLAFQSFLRHPQQQTHCRHLLLLYGILNHIHIDWPALISNPMLKAKKYNAYHHSYALLISRILEYKGVNVEVELTQAIQAIGTKIGETTFCQKGFVAHGRMILHKDDDHQDVSNDDMDAHMAEPVQVVAPTDAGPFQIPSSSTLSMAEHFAKLSKQLEDMSLAQQAHFDQIFEWQQTHEEYVIDQFNDFDTRLGNIENHLNLQPPKRPPVRSFSITILC
ncbi:hypothetical protein LR48_Vigan04g141600 [Vigna angularis]|uniref:Uncharacterized protein n=1 Tax=Phaseolus angularis TaxID=3914 RepID=A0A0L9UEQ1_PHAAN|nr:hypothetical protein LR48_Vigan04g141600 [Vigna angularis]